MANKTTATLNKGIKINKPDNQAAPAGFAKLSVHHILVNFLGAQVLVSAWLKYITPHFPEVEFSTSSYSELIIFYSIMIFPIIWYRM